jgi:hypothetical protein
MADLINKERIMTILFLDTPPVGLVSDALELYKHLLIPFYIVRQNFFKKGNDHATNNRVRRVRDSSV